MKWLYYGFGGFIGFVCALVISMIFIALENSEQLLTNFGRDYGVFGQYLLKLFNALPFFGIVIGLLLVRLMFSKEFDKNESDQNIE